MAWEDDVIRLRENGYSWDEINDYKARQSERLQRGGYTQFEVDDYFGQQSDPTQYETRARERYTNAVMQPGTDGAPAQQILDNPFEAFVNGWQLSAPGLGIRNELPDQIAPENMGLAMRIAQGAGIMVGDIPVMVAGAFGGAALGSAAGTAVFPGPGTVAGAIIGGGAGAFALPTLIREEYIDALQNGWATGPRDFLARQAGIAWETTKSATVGAVTAPAGAFTKAALVTRGVTRPVTQVAALGSELTAMTTVAAGLEGHLPTKEDFIDGAILLSGFKIAGSVTRLPSATKELAQRLEAHWAKTGERPADAAARAAKDPVFREQVIGERRTQEPVVEMKPDAIGEVMSVEQAAANAPVRARVPEPTPAEAKPPEMTLENAREVILARIGRTSEAKTISERALELKAEWIDSLAPIHAEIRKAGIEGKKLSPEQLEVTNLVKLLDSSAGRAEAMVRYEMFDLQANVTGKSFDAILKPFKGEDVQNFKAYALARWAVEKTAAKKETGANLEAARKIIKEDARKFEPAFKELQEYQNSALHLLVEAGLVSEAKFTGITERVKAYIPAFRLGEAAEKRGAGKGSVTYDPVKAFTGSEKKIADIYTSIIKNMFLFRELADRNVANRAFVDLLEKHNLAGKVTRTQKTKLDEKEISKLAEELGLEKENIPEGIDFDIFRPARHRLAGDEIVVYREGKAETWKLDNPEVARILRGMDQVTLSTLDKLLRIPTRFQRTMITLAPSFPVRQMFMDTSWSFITTPGVRNTAGEFIEGVGLRLTKGDAYKEWVRSGGANSSIRRLEKEYIQSGVLRDHKKTDFFGGIRNVAATPYRTLRFIADLQADASRVGRFAADRRREKTSSEAAVASRETTLDFSKQGSQARRLNAAIAFFAPYLNGMSRSAAALKDPMTHVKAVASITLPTLGMWLLYKDEEWYQEAPNYMKDTGLVFRANGTTWYIPLAPGFSFLYGGVPRRVMEDFVQDNPVAYQEMLQGFGMSMFPPGLVYSAFTPVMEHMTNHSFFRDAPVEPDHLARSALAPERFSNYTSETARILAQHLEDIPLVRNFDLSPSFIENYVRGWGGTLGASALVAADKALDAAGVSNVVPPSMTLADTPFLRSFAVRYPSANTPSIRRYYDRMRKMEQVRGSLDRSLETFDLDRFANLMEKHPMGMAKLEVNRTAMENSRKFVDMVYANPALTPTEKRQLLDMTYGNMVLFARLGNEVLDEIGIE